MNGGQVIAKVLKKHNVEFIFTLIGGHISPILVGCKKEKIRVIDVRHEVNAVFAADAVSRLTGVPGIAAVTAGPGVTNTITAVKNAQMAQSPLILIGGSTATILKNRGSLQDIDQLELIKPHVKWHATIKKVKNLPKAFSNAFRISQEGVPGPVFIEIPVDILYDETLVRDWYVDATPKGSSFKAKIIRWYLRQHLKKQFSKLDDIQFDEPQHIKIASHSPSQLKKAIENINLAQKPLLIIGSQTMLHPQKARELAKAINKLNIPVFLTGMARGLLGVNHKLQLRHKRTQALTQCDLVVLCGLPNDFRLNYGMQIKKHTYHIAINRSKRDLKLNKRPNLGILADSCNFLIDLSSLLMKKHHNWENWLTVLKERNQQRDDEIKEQAKVKMKLVNPLELYFKINENLDKKSILVVDGGDFVATGAYILQPKTAFSWLDPGVFGTLGVGAGFALGAKLARPNDEVYIFYGDGSAGYSLMEYDTFVRHDIPIIAIIGNDACWTQIYRDQISILKDDVACMLNFTNYQDVAIALGAQGKIIKKKDNINKIIKQAKAIARKGKPVVINVHISQTNFRKGSISI